MDIICRIAILSQLLHDGKVDTLKLWAEIRNAYSEILGDTFNIFRRACRIIDDYCQTGGKNLLYGTGLQMPIPDYLIGSQN